ncbi:hypothetical protein [Novosphingobium sp. SG707]|uniref:hypothetical protein n=1 Tax=Novosphingobium sp. SG707 TaxID=2586996 RepID=UPI001446E27C|nr:hypothetical protein [Novosphingobium sp. SG707]NKI99277.1 hypothetical protein [Novosphingobium sp. SG707]
MNEPLPKHQRVVPLDLVERMAQHLNRQSRDELMDRYGISYNTWRKLRAGDPICASVAERLEQRVRQNLA